MEETHLGVKRFENMLTLLMIAFAAAFSDGLVRIESLPIPMMKCRNVQRISIFRYGYVNLLHDFWLNVKNVAAKPIEYISLLGEQEVCRCPYIIKNIAKILANSIFDCLTIAFMYD